MHMQGTPRSMQDNPQYKDVVNEIREFFRQQYDTLTVAGIPSNYLCFDPGIGFGKSLEHNQKLLNGISEITVEGRPILIGLSRKSFISKLTGLPKVKDRGYPTVALTSYTRKLGARIHRVHQVKENHDALRMAEALS